MYTSLLFNSVVFMFVNFILALYFSLRFFQVMKNHNKLVVDIKGFHSMVLESRSSLDYTTMKVSEVIREIEDDINEELKITHDLTKLHSDMAVLLKRFSEVEEKVIELVRTDYNMESITISTPADINQEINRVIMRKRRKRLEMKSNIKNDTKNGNSMNNREIISSR